MASIVRIRLLTDISGKVAIVNDFQAILGCQISIILAGKGYFFSAWFLAHKRRNLTGVDIFAVMDLKASFRHNLRLWT